MNVLVTGGAGFIGSHVTRALAARGHHVTVYDNLTTGRLGNLANASHHMVRGDILDSPLLDRAVTDTDAVVHLAAATSVPASLIQPRSVHEVNATGTVNVLAAARRAGTHVVFASSAAVYGHTDTAAVEDLPPQPISPYGASKAAGEAYLAAYATSYRLPALALRLFNVYGPAQPVGGYAAVVPVFIAAAVNGKPLTIHGDGLQVRDFVHIRTVTDVIVRAVEDRVTSPTPVNVASGSPTTVKELAALVARIVGPTGVEFGPARDGDVGDSVALTSRLRALFPGVAQTPLADGLADMAAWFRGHRR